MPTMRRVFVVQSDTFVGEGGFKFTVKAMRL